MTSYIVIDLDSCTIRNPELVKVEESYLLSCMLQAAHINNTVEDGLRTRKEANTILGELAGEFNEHMGEYLGLGGKADEACQLALDMERELNQGRSVAEAEPIVPKVQAPSEK